MLLSESSPFCFSHIREIVGHRACGGKSYFRIGRHAPELARGIRANVAMFAILNAVPMGAMAPLLVEHDYLQQGEGRRSDLPC